MRPHLVPATFAAALFVMMMLPAVAAADRPVFIWGPECHFAESLEAAREECEATAPGYRHAFLVPCTAARSIIDSEFPFPCPGDGGPFVDCDRGKPYVCVGVPTK